ncbi:MAG: ATP synthase F1 subunit gamma [Anaerolineae bacterium]|nr:ATP synthase F1 subunit gamma [Anaerolineae bacterium]
MATLREIRRRIRSVRNIAKVTRAMEMVAAAKMRRAQSRTLATRPYAEKAWEVLVHLALQRTASEAMHPLLASHPGECIGLVVVTSNKGLCGGYNHNIVNLACEFIEHAPMPVEVITVGRVGRRAMLRAGYHIRAVFEDIPDLPVLMDITGITRAITEDFLSGHFGEVYVVYTRFVNTMVQVPEVARLLPLRALERSRSAVEAIQRAAEQPTLLEYVYEPSPGAILNALVPRFLEMQVYQIMLEASASEHSARMVAMRNATDSAGELIDALTLTYNRARQEAITKEMVDIAGGAEALAKARGRR